MRYKIDLDLLTSILGWDARGSEGFATHCPQP
jgi:hypothetical protein